MTTTTPNAGAAADQARERLVHATTLVERRETLAGVSTAIFEAGDGPPMVLLHGQGEFWAVWMPVIGDLVSSHRVIVVDLPGHGASTTGEGRLDGARVLRWVDELIDATCAARPVLVGHLLGGAIAARYAVGNSNRLAHLVLVDTMGLAWFRPSPSFAIPMMRFMARPTPQSRDRLFRRCFLDFDTVGDRFGAHWDDLRTYALDRAKSAENKAALRTLMSRVGAPPIPRPDLDRINVAATLIHGRDDLQVPLRVAEKASQRHRWPLHVIEGVRDDPAAEQPDAFVTALRDALAKKQTS